MKERVLDGKKAGALDALFHTNPDGEKGGGTGNF